MLQQQPPPAAARISQELFDETLLENEEVFELEPDEAVKETIDQLTKQYGCDDCLSHLCLFHPSSDRGKQERLERREFLQNLSLLDQCVKSDGSIHLEKNDKSIDDSIRMAMNGIKTCCCIGDTSSQFLVLFQQEQAMYTLMSFLNVVSTPEQALDESRVSILTTTLDTLIAILAQKVELRDLFVAWERWGMLFVKLFLDNMQIKTLLIRLACVACKGCAPNKVLWMRSKESMRVLLDGFDINNDENADSIVELWTESCRLIAVLCKYDDFRSSDRGPTVSSAHEHATEFARAGAVPILVKVLQNSSSTDLTAASLSALRVLAIQDEIVQTMVATGLLTTAQDVIQSSDNIKVQTAVLGLMRNLSANDEIKTTLCSSLPFICNAMRENPKTALLQEHGCATLASMALRKPRNAQQIVQNDGHACILTAMRMHPSNVALQRQGALAIRNICSRQQESNKQAVLDLGAEEVLKDVAGQHQGSVDEAYAALKELGCSVDMLTIQQDGTTTSTGRTEVFGTVHPSFRPDFEPSKELEGIEL